ncbi:MAG: sensor histidine kinase, partial [Blastocatellia bacterium]
GARITVSDTGRGISPEFLPYVFDRFRQADFKSGGLGLGLAITRSLVEMHGGAIEASSDGEGKGCTFKVCLPIAGPQPDEPSPTDDRDTNHRFFWSCITNDDARRLSD